MSARKPDAGEDSDYAVVTRERMILDNQYVIMRALQALLPPGHRMATDLMYHSAKTRVYLAGTDDK